MAEGWLRHLAGDRLEALSAGTHPIGVNAHAVAAMAEVGVDLAEHTSDSIEAFLDDPPELVIAVCDVAHGSCPTLPGATRLLHWPFPDPAYAVVDEPVPPEFRSVRDAIRERIERWLAEGAPPLALPARSGSTET